MKHLICTVGRPGGWAEDALAEYVKRIRGFQGLELFYSKQGPRAEKEIEARAQGFWKVCLDPLGDSRSTMEWRKEWDRWERSNRSKICWMIGGADGHSEEFRRGCDVIRSLGPQTLSHELALVVLVDRFTVWKVGGRVILITANESS